MPAFSVLDLAPVPAGKTAADALRNTAELAQLAERLGYTRYWMAEHHNMPGVASSSTSVLIGYVASVTSRIRVGSGGVMLPNHAPLVIAEQFGTLATLYPDRIDLGLGRAPGTDMITARALRRGMSQGDQFPDDVVELIGYLQPSEAGQPVRAIPGEGTNVPVWMLGSSLYGAQLAAHLGLPYAFASHFAPDMLEEAIETYRRSFRPGITDRPHFMMAVNVFAADDADEAVRLRTSMQQAFLNLRTGRPGPLPTPVDDFSALASPQEAAMVNRALRCSAVGDPTEVKSKLSEFLDRYVPDEFIITGQIHDHAARLRSFEIAAEVMTSLNGQTSDPDLRLLDRA
ncbi:LLM class flavin-dependent oxidoreductase [Falsiphaeobacter marinintestinus]|uniref:LLM class flavin-dependent oxidoreductase n=1 Tax=Falsiphaeobacter marinintestinus TaxID=1492905 RepID=UPI0011B777A8|nr:LLM class flavin-dependent oxidoreductase [Phaeobacter marinintestinus]